MKCLKYYRFILFPISVNVLYSIRIKAIIIMIKGVYMVNFQLAIAVQQGQRILFAGFESIIPKTEISDILFALELYHDHELLIDYLIGTESFQRSILVDQFSFKNPVRDNTVAFKNTDAIIESIENNTIVLYYNNNSWFALSKHQSLNTVNFIPMAEFVKRVYSNEGYDEELVSVLTEHDSYPLIINQIDEFADYSVAQLRPLFAEHPKEMEYTDKYHFS